MFQPIPLRAFISIVSTVFIFFFTVQVNHYETYNFLKIEGFSDNKIDFIEIIEILAAIVGGVILMQLINIYSKDKIMIVSQLLYLIGIANLTLFENHQLIIINLALMAASRFIFCTILLIIFINNFKNRYCIGLALYFVLWIVAYMIGDYIITLLHKFKVTNIFLSLTFMQIATILNIYLYYKNSKNSLNHKLNFTSMFAALDLEMLLGFIIGYIVFSIYWDHEVFASNSGYVVTKIDNVKFYLIFGTLLSIYPARIMINYFNKYKLNIYILTGWLVALLVYQNIGYNELYSKITICIFGAFLYIIFINNLLILTDKFNNLELNYAITIYLSITMIGGYIGVIATDNMIETFGLNGFLISLYSVSLMILMYYSLQFFIRRLYTI